MKSLLSIIVIILVIVGGYFLLNQEKSAEIGDIAINATLYKSPNCGCCVGYSKALKEHGFDVDVVSTENMQLIKDQYNIPKNMESCHTVVIGDYFIEGHIPFEVVDKLLAEEPTISGIALPNMPAGTPGMPGIKDGLYKIFQSINGEFSEFITI